MFSKRHLYVLTACLGCCFQASSQTFNGYIGLHQTSDYIDRYRFEDVRSSYLLITDSSFQRNLNQVETTRTITTEFDLGFHAGFHYRMPIGKRWTLMSGLGVNFRKLKSETLYADKLIAILRSETVNSSLFINNNECDQDIFIGDYQQVDPSYTMLQLEIPLMLRFDIVPQHWSVGLGAKLAAPVFISQKRFVITRTTAVNEMDQVVCTHEYKVVKDKSGEGFSRASVSLAADMEYWLKRIGFGVGVEKQSTNLLTKNFYDYYASEKARKALPLTSYLRVMYKF